MREALRFLGMVAVVAIILIITYFDINIPFVIHGALYLFLVGLLLVLYSIRTDK